LGSFAYRDKKVVRCLCAFSVAPLPAEKMPFDELNIIHPHPSELTIPSMHFSVLYGAAWLFTAYRVQDVVAGDRVGSDQADRGE
jgi:hypothetical protein